MEARCHLLLSTPFTQRTREREGRGREERGLIQKETRKKSQLNVKGSIESSSANRK